MSTATALLVGANPTAELMRLTADPAVNNAKIQRLFRELKGKYFWITPVEDKKLLGGLVDLRLEVNEWVFEFDLYDNGRQDFSRPRIFALRLHEDHR